MGSEDRSLHLFHVSALHLWHHQCTYSTEAGVAVKEKYIWWRVNQQGFASLPDIWSGVRAEEWDGIRVAPNESFPFPFPSHSRRFTALERWLHRTFRMHEGYQMSHKISKECYNIACFALWFHQTVRYHILNCRTGIGVKATSPCQHRQHVRQGVRFHDCYSDHNLIWLWWTEWQFKDTWPLSK